MNHITTEPTGLMLESGLVHIGENLLHTTVTTTNQLLNSFDLEGICRHLKSLLLVLLYLWRLAPYQLLMMPPLVPSTPTRHRT